MAELIRIVVALIVVGLLLWLVETYLPIDPMIRRLIQAVVLIAIVLWLLSTFGLFSVAGLR